MNKWFNEYVGVSKLFFSLTPVFHGLVVSVFRLFHVANYLPGVSVFTLHNHTLRGALTGLRLWEALSETVCDEGGKKRRYLEPIREHPVDNWSSDLESNPNPQTIPGNSPWKCPIRGQTDRSFTYHTVYTQAPACKWELSGTENILLADVKDSFMWHAIRMLQTATIIPSQHGIGWGWGGWEHQHLLKAKLRGLWKLKSLSLPGMVYSSHMNPIFDS